MFASFRWFARYRASSFGFAAQLLAVFLPLSVSAQSDQNAAHIVSSRPSASVRGGAGSIEAATVNRDIHKSDTLLTDAYGRLSVLLPNRLLLKVAESTEFQYEGASESDILGKVMRGKVWLRGQKQPKEFGIQTPTATASIRGTEWFIEVAANGSTKVGVMDGIVAVSNQYGSIELGANELGVIEPGQAPVKQVILQPENAVKWTLNYVGFWEESDLKRAGTFAPAIQEALESFYRSDLEGAFKAYAKGNIEKNSAAPLALHGFLELVADRGPSAEALFEDAHAADPTWALPLAHLSLIALVENRQEDALRYAMMASEVEPESTVAYLARAYALKGALRMEEAYAAAKAAAAGAPHFDPANLIAARLAIELERFSDAGRYLNAVPVSSPLRAEVESLSGFLGLRLDDVDGALAHFERARALDPSSPDAYMGRSIALFRQDKAEEAFEAMTKATLLSPQDSSYQSYLAKAYFEVDNHRDARQALSRAKRLDPNDPTPFLYEALVDHSEYQPGRAFKNLVQAMQLNDHRAVFRSRFLLDQDKAVVTSNLAQVYHEIGFDYSATQEAARALDVDPTNQAAHRRLFFALQFDPRGYEQAASSERLLNNLFSPPSRAGIVLDEDTLSPYQSVFDRPGFDPILVANGQYSRDDDDSYSASGLGELKLAGELESPFAYLFQISSDTGRSKRRISEPASPELLSGVDQETLTYLGLLKWDVTPEVSAYLEARYRTTDSDTDGRVTTTSFAARALPPPPPMMSPTPMPSGTPPPGKKPSKPKPTPTKKPTPVPMRTPPPPTPIPTPEAPPSPRAINNTSDESLLDTDFGLDIHPMPDFHILTHLSYHSGDSDSEDRTIFNMPLSETKYGTRDNRQDFWIAQGALWKQLGNHHLQLGVRHYREVHDVDEDGTVVGMSRISEPGIETSVLSAFVVEQYNGIEDVTVTAGLNFDDLRYREQGGRENNELNLGPSIGATWRLSDSAHLRAAYVNNVAGDRSERLQQTFIAGFPWQRVTNSDPYSEEQLFNLRYRAYLAGLDVYLNNPYTVIGIEGEFNEQTSRYLNTEGEDVEDMRYDEAKRGRLYIESLLTEQFSAGLTYRFDRLQYSNLGYRHGIDGFAYYFTPYGFALKFRVGWSHIDTSGGDGPGEDETVLRYEPGLEGYPFSEQMRVNLAVPIEDDGTISSRIFLTWYM